MSHYRISYEMIIVSSAMFSGFYINGGTSATPLVTHFFSLVTCGKKFAEYSR